MHCVNTKMVELAIYKHPTSKRLLALCPEVNGFSAQAKDMEQLKVRVPRLMKALLEAQGKVVERVDFVEDVRVEGAQLAIHEGFLLASMIAKAEICLAA